MQRLFSLFSDFLFPLQLSLNSDIMREIDLDMRRKSVQCKTEELS